MKMKREGRKTFENGENKGKEGVLPLTFYHVFRCCFLYSLFLESDILCKRNNVLIYG